MSIFHFSVKTISRNAGQNTIASAAYRSASLIIDEQTKQVHDYTKKQGVVHAELILPDGENADRAEFWNKLEQHHKRKDAVLAREIIVALPHELDEIQRNQIAIEYAKYLAKEYSVAVDVAIHKPSKDGDQRNHHAHIMLSACYVKNGELGKKAVELDPIHCQRAKIKNFAEKERYEWALLNEKYAVRNNLDIRIDWRTLEAQRICDRAPGVHNGVILTARKRRGESIPVCTKNAVLPISRDEKRAFLWNGLQNEADFKFAYFKSCAEEKKLLEEQLKQIKIQQEMQQTPPKMRM